MSFLAPWLLLGLPLAAIPVLLHLLNKPRYRREPWGAMMFLEEAVQTRSRSIQMQEWVLMALRTLAVLLLVLAMSRPVLTGSEAGGADQPTTHVLVMDTSYSMQRNGAEGSLFDAAKRHALALVDGMNPQDNMLIVRSGSRTEALFPRPVFDQAYLRSQLEQLAAGPEDSNLPAALEQALWLLGFSTQPRHRIVVLDDGQRGAWRMEDANAWSRVSRQLAELPHPPALYSVRVPADLQGTYLAVTALRAGTPLPDIFRPVEFEVEIRNDGAEPVTRLLRFSVDGRRRDAREVTLAPGPNAVQLTHQFREAGSHRVEVELGGDDLPIDNRAALALEVLERIPVLIVEGHSGPGRLGSDGGLLALALEAGRTPDGGALFEVKRMTQLEMDTLNLSDLLEYKTLVLANVPAFPSRFGALVQQYLEAGGGVLMGLGPAVSPESYNRWTTDTGGWVPVRVGEWMELGAEPLSPTFPAGRAGEILDVFDLSRTRSLDEVRVRAYRAVEPLGNGIVAGQFGGDVFLWVSEVGRGPAGYGPPNFRRGVPTFPQFPITCRWCRIW